jgi:hypothetical protein
MSDPADRETALLVSDGLGHYYVIPRSELERYRIAGEVAADLTRRLAGDTAGFLLRSRWAGPSLAMNPATDTPDRAAGDTDPAGPGFAVTVPLALLRR